MQSRGPPARPTSSRGVVHGLCAGGAAVRHRPSPSSAVGRVQSIYALNIRRLVRSFVENSYVHINKMSCPLLADSLQLDSWSLGDFKVTAKSKQRFTPIYASGKFATFRLSSQPLLCPWGVGKFQLWMRAMWVDSITNSIWSLGGL